MRKEIMKRFFSILVLTIGITGVLFLLTVSMTIQNSTKEDMRLNLLVLDRELNYEKPLQNQIKSLPTTVGSKTARYTILDADGTVLADTFYDTYNITENHKNREEIIAATKKGSGYSSRYSNTLHINMQYAAIQSSRSDCVLRIAIPATGLFEYLKGLLPAMLGSIAVAMIVAMISARSLANKLIRPISGIVSVMENYRQDDRELKFEETPYEELNIIMRAAKSMSVSVKEYTDKLDFERIVRQEFFANASHELKTPITSIRGYIELLLGGFTTDKETQKEFMNRVLSETEHITTLVNDILLISQLETNELDVTKSEIRIAVIMEDIIASIKPMAIDQEVLVQYDYRPIVVYASIKHIRELLTNLISNAVKYNRSKGRVQVCITNRGKDLVIVVSDTGVGIPEESIPRIFERFYRVDKGRSRKVSGTGLGLSIVKHIVNYYDGSILVESRVNEGTSFTCVLPGVII